MFIVEDGTGLQNANAYVSVEEFKDYWNMRNIDLAQKTDAEIEACIIIATQYIDKTFKYIGSKSTNEQSLQWPRSYAYNLEGYVYSGLPNDVVFATCEAGYYNLNGKNLFVASEKGITEKTENVGPVQTTYKYMEEQSGMIAYQSVNMYLRDLIRRRTNRVRRY